MNIFFPLSLHPLVRQLEAYVFQAPHQAINAARELLKSCHEKDQLSYIFEKMGFAYLILGEHRLSCLYYEEANVRNPNSMYILANFAHSLFELGEHDRAVQMGREAMQLKDTEACSSANTLPRLKLDSWYRGSLNIISFALYGHQARYCEMAVLNVLAARKHYPSFTCRFYIDDSVPQGVIHRLRNLGAQCQRVPVHVQHVPGIFWRFLAMDDPDADCVLVRDVDSLLDGREAIAVRDWQQSNQAFHIIRDDCCHTELILAGMFGIRSGALRGVTEHLLRYFEVNQAAIKDRFSDQLFLRHSIWPAVRDANLTHDSVYQFGKNLKSLIPRNAPLTGIQNTFIGANHATCRIECQFDRPIPSDSFLCLTFSQASGEQICCYPMQKAVDQRSNTTSNVAWFIFLPALYMNPIHSGQWQNRFSVERSSESIGVGSIDPAMLGYS